jgi:hypothetical protein
MCKRPPAWMIDAMSTFDYILDSALVLVVLLQIREHELNRRQIIRPLLIVALAVANYLRAIPTGGNDLVLVVLLALVGLTIGSASGLTVKLRTSLDGKLMLRAGWLSAFLWVLGMGSRFAFIYWVSHSGVATIARFSATHSITSGDAWTVALLAMAVCEVGGRSAVMYRALRRSQRAAAVAPDLA